MQLTLYTDYAFRVLIHLADKSDEVVTVQQVANALGVSRNHLVKVVHHLGLMGLLKSVRGKGGGIVLARPAEQISMAEVVRLMEKNLDLLECFHNTEFECGSSNACNLRMALRMAQAQFFRTLEQFSLKDLLRQHTHWEQLYRESGDAGPAAVPVLQESVVHFPKRNLLGSV